jgi:hypothetical protein
MVDYNLVDAKKRWIILYIAAFEHALYAAKAHFNLVYSVCL